MKTTELTSLTHDDTDQGLVDGALGDSDITKSNNLNGGSDCSLDGSMLVFDSTLIEVPFSAVGAEDEKYADGGLTCVLIEQR